MNSCLSASRPLTVYCRRYRGAGAVHRDRRHAPRRRNPHADACSAATSPLLQRRGPPTRPTSRAGDDDLKACGLVLDDIAERLPSRDAGSSFARMLEPGKRTKTHHFFLLFGELLA